MKKAIVCLLAILLILAFVSCNATPDSGSSSTTTTPEPSTPTPSSGTSTEQPKEATDSQLEAFESGYTATLIGVLSKNQDPSLSSVSIEGDVYKFSKFLVTLDGTVGSAIGTLNGEATITPNKLILNVDFTDKKEATISVVGKIEIADDNAIFTINGKNCIISNDKIKSISTKVSTPGEGMYGNP